MGSYHSHTHMWTPAALCTQDMCSAPYVHNESLPLVCLPRRLCVWLYVSWTLFPWPEGARALFLQPYLDSCGPFCSQHMSGNDICLIHDYHCFTCLAHVVLGTMCLGHCCCGQSMPEHYSRGHIWTPADLSAHNMQNYILKGDRASVVRAEMNT